MMEELRERNQCRPKTFHRLGRIGVGARSETEKPGDDFLSTEETMSGDFQNHAGTVEHRQKMKDEEG